MKLLIPSAKIINEDLQSIGKIPSVIYPFNGGIVFDYLLNQYNNIVSSIEVVCYEKIEYVRQRLNSYKNKNINIIELNHLEDLGYSVLCGLTDLDSIIINFGDTIVFDDINEGGDDCFFYSEDYVSETWTFFEEENGKILSIYDKELNREQKFGKLFVGVFKISNIIDFKECLETAVSNPQTGVNSFYQALTDYSKKHRLHPIKTSNWLDIGHADRYYDSSLEVKAREFNHITIDKNRGILRKSSDNVEKFIGEIKWYLKLPAEVEYVRPRIFDYSTMYTNPFVCMEYYSYHTLHELLLYGELKKTQWIDIFSRIIFVCNDFSKYKVTNEYEINNSLKEVYLEKTMERLEQVRLIDRFKSFFSDSIIVNGKTYLPLDDIVIILKDIIPKYLYNVSDFCIIHGDLCFSNILIDNNLTFIKVIDPRGKFGNYDIYGDQRYELAKLLHSVDGKYDYIIKNLFELSYDEKRCTIKYEIHNRRNDYDIYQLFLYSFKSLIGNDLKKIELIESLLFLSMIPLHNESIEHQMLMLGTGLDILNRVENITIKKEW